MNRTLDDNLGSVFLIHAILNDNVKIRYKRFSNNPGYEKIGSINSEDWRERDEPRNSEFFHRENTRGERPI